MSHPSGAVAPRAELGGWLAFTLYVAAARAAATPVQLAALRDRVVPMFEQLRTSTQAVVPILDEVRHIMGAAWRPEGAWARAMHHCLQEG